MEEKIKFCLQIIDLDCLVSYDDELSVGTITFNHSCVTATILDLISRFVNLVAITCIAPNTYSITFRSK